MSLDALTLETLQNARSRLLHTNPQPLPPNKPKVSPKQRPASATRVTHSAGSSPEMFRRQRPQSAKEREGDGVLPDDISKDVGSDMAWQRVSNWLKLLAQNEGMDQTSFLRSTTSSFLATSYPGIQHARPVLHAASPAKITQRPSQQQHHVKDSTLELQTLQARRIAKMEVEIASLKDELETLRAARDCGSSAQDGANMRVVFEEQLAKSKRACDAVMREKGALLSQLDNAVESRNSLAAAVDGYKVQVAQLNRKLEQETQRARSSPAGKSLAATDAKMAEAFDANSHLVAQVKQLQARLDEQQQLLQLEARQKQTMQTDAAAAAAASQRQNDTLRQQLAQLQMQFQQLQSSSIAAMAAAPSDAPLAVLNSELVQLVETRGAAIAALQSEMSAAVEASLGTKAAEIISKERKRIEPHVTSLVQAVRTSERRVQQLQEQLKEAHDQLLQLQHSVMVANLTLSQGSRRPSSASSRGTAASIPETEAAARVLQAQADALKLQLKEVEGELLQARHDAAASRAEAETYSVQLEAAKREASDSQALVLSLKAMSKGGADAVSSATENATLKQELSRAQENIKLLKNQEAAAAQSTSSLEHELEAKMDQIDELKGQIMSSLLKNRELALEVESVQNELRDKEQELRGMQNYVASLETDGNGGGGEGSFLLAEVERLRAEVDFSNERRIDSEYKAAEVQLTLEKLELEFNAVREAHQQSQQELQQLQANQENMMEEGLQEMQAQLDELHAHLHATRGELASSEEECAFALNNMALMLKKSNRVAEALPLYIRALELRQKALGENHVELSPIMVNIGALHFMAANYCDASAFFQQALEIRVTELGADHSQTLSAQQWVVKCEAKLQEGAAAEGGD